jgi:hypothetical protein
MIVEHDEAHSDWLDRLVAVLFATIAVIGLVTITLTLVFYFPGMGPTDVAIP